MEYFVENFSEVHKHVTNMFESRPFSTILQFFTGSTNKDLAAINRKRKLQQTEWVWQKR